MKSLSHNKFITLSLILFIALMIRLVLLSMIHNPGLNDQNHYYNLGQRLLQGQGFTINYVWHYSHVPDDIIHPTDHWMPLAGVAVAAGMSLGGETPHGALIVFIITGTILPLLVYVATKQLNGTHTSALIATLIMAVLPDAVWNSLRSDSTIINMLLITGGIGLLNHGLRHQKWWAFALCGVSVGFAYLTRNDSILFMPMLAVVLILYLWKGRDYTSGRAMGLALVLIPLAFVVTITPWLIRNQQEIGMLGTAETSRMFFMVDQRDHYAYDTPLTLETMLERQSMSDILVKRVFELGAGLKQMLISLDIIALFILIQLGWLLWRRDWEHLLLISPAIIWIMGVMFTYPILLPLKSQSGSFEKAFLTIIPLLIPLGAMALERLLQQPKVKWVIVGILCVWLGWQSYTLIDRETQHADIYYASIQKLADTLSTLPDVTDDGEIRIMSQDPYVMSTFGYASIMTPLASREKTLELAQRFSIDYLLAPSGRPALDDLYLQQDVDSRFILAAHIADAGEKPFELYQLQWE